MHEHQVLISTDKGLLDIDYIHTYLSERSYWARGRTRANVENSIINSLCFGVYAVTGAGVQQRQQQIGFARVVTDYTNFAWLCDVFIDEAYRGAGLGKRLVQTILEHPDLQTVGRIMLATRDAHELYRRYGFTALERPEYWMYRANRP
jgi:GNAT superfamily N-acetyltransferase